MCMPPLAGLQQLPPARGPPLRRAGGSNPTWAATTPRVLLRSQARLAMRPLTLPAALLLVWAALEVAATAAQAGGAAQVRMHRLSTPTRLQLRPCGATLHVPAAAAAAQPPPSCSRLQHTSRCTHPSTVWQQARQAGVTSMPCCTCSLQQASRRLLQQNGTAAAGGGGGGAGRWESGGDVPFFTIYANLMKRGDVVAWT